MWIVWGCNHGVVLHRQRSASRPRGKASTTWCHQRGPGMSHGPQTREVQRNFNKIPLHKEPINSILLVWRNKSTARKRGQKAPHLKMSERYHAIRPLPSFHRMQIIPNKVQIKSFASCLFRKGNLMAGCGAQERTLYKNKKKFHHRTRHWVNGQNRRIVSNLFPIKGTNKWGGFSN